MTRTTPLNVFQVPLAGIRLIEASAGTGKTWAICGLYLRLLLEQGRTVQQILVVTFTNAATAELRQRLRDRLRDTLAGLALPVAAAAAPAGDPFVHDLLASLRAQGIADAAMATQLQQALHSFDEAAVFTIHGFCQRALADTPFAAQMPLRQALVADDSALLAEAVHDLWRAHIASPAADPALAALMLDAGDTPERWAALLKRHLAKPLAREIWPDDIDTAVDTQAQQQAVHAAFTAARSAWRTGGPAAVALAQARIQAKQLHATHYKADKVQACAEAWAELLAQPAPQLAAPVGALGLLGASTLALRTTGKHSAPEHPFFTAAQALLDSLAQADRQRRLARLRLLRQVLHDGAARLRETKRAQRVVAFDDMLFNLHQRLVGDASQPAAPGLAAALRQRFPAALIDEFQDTDPLQWSVFHAIYGTAQATAEAAPLFLVGDPKQAIYSFRHADLHTYLQARSQASAVHTLADNQRASQPLIHALNHLFGQHGAAFMQPGLYYQPVAYGNKRRPVFTDTTGEARAALQVWSLPRGRQGPLMKAEARQRAADTCAGEIARLLTGARAGQVLIDDQPLDAGQIAVLVRSHSQGSLVRAALAALGVGSVELSQDSVFSGPDAEALERVLAAMLQPGRDGLLKAALATRWHGLDAPTLQALAADETAWLAQVQAFAAHGALWRRRGVGQLLQHWRQAAGVAGRLLTLPDGARRLTNLLHLGELLHQAEAEQPSPEALLQWLQAQRDTARGDEATQLRLESDQHLVQIVTIHKSKGLEYPVVFCPFLWDGAVGGQSGDGLDGLGGHDADGQAVIDFRAGFDAAADPKAAKAQAKLEAAAETLRLVYVALTRAVHRCTLLTGSYRRQHGKHITPTESARGLLHWLVLGDGLTPTDWFKPNRKPPPPFEIAAAWTRWCDALGDSHALAIAPLPLPLRQPLLPADCSAQPLQALPAPTPLPTGWWIASFSSLVHGAQAAAQVADPDPDTDTDADADAANDAERPLQPRPGADHDALAEPPDPPALDAAAAALPPDDPLRFPRGTLAGECVHAAFEHADFSAHTTWPGAIADALTAHPPLPLPPGSDSAALPAMLHATLAQVLATPLPLGTPTPLRLASLGLHQRLNELEFHLHAPQLSAAALGRTLARHGVPAPRLGFGSLQGYLKGYIDMVFRHEGRWFIADWKSNHLGDAPADYAGPALQRAMTDHHYHLQALVYAVALQRWLQQRLPNYSHAQHFGGAVYLFVRGVRPHWQQADGTPAGLHFFRAPQTLLDDVTALLAGATA